MTTGRLLNTDNHDRDATGMRYVYPVVSRRAGGVSIGINLNPNNACNWACVYCQVPGLTRGGPPPLELDVLRSELRAMLGQVVHGDFMDKAVPSDARSLKDIAFSGNGEPTSAPEFAEAVAAVIEIVEEYDRLGKLPLRLITNGSLIGKESVQAGLKLLAINGGEVWFKVDAVIPERILEVNGVSVTEGATLKRLQQCASLVPTWVQTCLFALDGVSPSECELNAYLSFLSAAGKELRGVLLYSLARPSMQPAAPRLSKLPAAWLEGFALRTRHQTGLAVQVSP